MPADTTAADPGVPSNDPVDRAVARVRARHDTEMVIVPRRHFVQETRVAAFGEARRNIQDAITSLQTALAHPNHTDPVQLRTMLRQVHGAEFALENASEFLERLANTPVEAPDESPRWRPSTTRAWNG